MTGIEIAVAAVSFIFVGMGLCALGFFCYFMIRKMDTVARAADEARQAVAQLKDLLGENSPLARAARGVNKLSENLPEMLGGLKLFSETFSKVYETAFQPNKTSAPRPAITDDSAFIPYSETQAADYERRVIMEAQKLVLSREEMASMRTDDVEEKPTPAEEPAASVPGA